MPSAMTPMLYVRRDVLGLSQAELATIAETTQGTVSKWESGDLEPDREQLERIREAIKARFLPWKDSWFFEIPAEAAE